MGLDWSPFGGNPVPGDPGQVRALAQRFQDFVGQVGKQNGLLMDVHDGVGGIWMSPAGRAFSPHLGQLPGQLHKLHTSYSDAADGLDAYWPELQDAQSMATTALAKVHAAIQAQEAAKAAQAQDFQAHQAHQAQLEQQAQQQANHTGLPVTFTFSPYSPSPAVVAQTDQANQAYQAAMNLKDQAVQKAQAAARRLSSQLDGASKAGIQNPHHSFWGGLVHDAESLWDDGTHWVSQHVGAIETVAAVAALGPAGLLLTSDGRAMLKHAMEAMNPVFEVVSGVCGVVSFGLAIVGLIPGVGEVADALNEGVMLVKTGADAGMLVDGKLEGNDEEVKQAEEGLIGDAAGLATGGESRLFEGADTVLSKGEEIAQNSEKIGQLTDDANQAHAAAGEATFMADRAGAQASRTETAAALFRFNGNAGKADLLEENAARLRDSQASFQSAASDAKALEQSKLGEIGKLNDKVDTLTETVNEGRSASGMVKEFTGWKNVQDVQQNAHGLTGWSTAAWKATTDSSEGLGQGVGHWATNYFGADGNRALQMVRVSKYALLTTDVAHGATEQSHNIGRVEEGVGLR